jgi:hypothetical protein
MKLQELAVQQSKFIVILDVKIFFLWYVEFKFMRICIEMELFWFLLFCEFYIDYSKI